MTRFADQLFNDLMQEHGPALAQTTVPAAPKRHLAGRPVLMTAGAGGLAVAAAVGALVAGGGTPAYAVTANPDGTVTLAVYEQPGIAQVNAKLRSLGDRVVVVPVGANCPSITTLRAPAVRASQISVHASTSGNGSVTVAAKGVPAGDILVMAFATGTNGEFSMQQTTTNGGHASGSASKTQSAGSGQPPRTSSSRAGSSGSGTGSAAVFGFGASKLTSGSVPSCVSIPAAPAPPAGSGTPSHGGGTVTPGKPVTSSSGNGGAAKSTSSAGNG